VKDFSPAVDLSAIQLQREAEWRSDFLPEVSVRN
jgi:hypothetical protein